MGSATIRNLDDKPRTIHVRKRPVRLGPGQSVAVDVLTEAEVTLAVDDPDLVFDGTVDVIRFLNFRDTEVVGTYSSTGSGEDIVLEDVVSVVQTDKSIDDEPAADDDVSTDETADDAVDEDEENDEVDPKSGSDLLKFVREGADVDEIVSLFRKPAFVQALDIIGLPAEGTKQDLAEALIIAVRG